LYYLPSACKRAENGAKALKTLIFRKSAYQRVYVRCVHPPTFEKSVFFRAFAPFSALVQTLGK